MFGGQILVLQACEDLVKSWWGKIFSLPSSSTKLEFVLISENNSHIPWCFRIVSIKNTFASLTIFKSHLYIEATLQIFIYKIYFFKKRNVINNSETERERERLIIYIYPRSWAALTAEIMLGWIGALFRTSTMSSIVLPCAWSSSIILPCMFLHIKLRQ